MADYEADRVVVELLAKADNFDRPIVQSVTKFESGMDRIAASATKAEVAVAGSSKRMSTAALQASTAMYRGYSDLGNLLTSDKSPFVVPVKQAPAATAAMKYVQVGAAALGGVMGGLLVTAVLAGASALAEFILKGKGTKAEIEALVEKLKEKARQTDIARQADEAFARTAEGAAQSLRKVTEALEAQNRTLEDNIALTKQKIQQDMATVRGGIAELEKKLALARDDLRLAKENAPLAAGAGANGQAEIRRAQERVDELAESLNRLKAAAAGGQRAMLLVDFPLMERTAEAAVDPIKRINIEYDRMRDNAEKAALGNAKLAASLQKTLIGIERNREAALKAARDAQKKGSGGLPKVTLGEVQSLVKDVFGSGTAITSTTGGKHAPNSYHYSSQGVDFVPQGGMKAFDKEMLRLAAEARGIKVLELLGPGDKGHGDHGHIAFSKTRQGPDQIAAARERQARAAERAADSEERRLQAYENEAANLDGQVIDARQALLTSAEQIADFELAAIEISRRKYNDNLASLVKLDKLHQDEADELKKANDERAKLRAELVKRREDERKFRVQEADAKRAIELQLGTKDAQRDLLESQTGLATTAKARRDLEKKLLDLQFEMERIQLEAIIAEYERLRIKKDLTELERQELADKQVQAELARERLGTLPDREANANSQNNVSNAGPLDSFLGSIPDTADEINEALESVAAGGLATFTDALTDAIVNFRSLGDVGRAVLQSITASLVKMAIQQVILHTIGKTLGTTAIATTTAQAAAAGAAWAPAAAAASLATLGNNAGPAAAALASTHALSAALALPKGFRLGGYTGSGDPSKAAGIVHNDEFVFDSPATRRIGVANLEALRTGVRPSNASAAAPGGRGGGFGPDAMGQMQNIVAEAIRAMPPINLFPTYDPVVAFERAVATPQGRSALLEFMGANRGAVNGTLQP